MSSQPLPQIVLKPRKALPFFSRHPWVFQGAVDWLVGEPSPGDVVDVIDDAERFVARGLFNPQSQICVRLYSWDEAVPLDESFWSQRLDDAIALRRGLFGIRSNGDPTPREGEAPAEPFDQRAAHDSAARQEPRPPGSMFSPNSACRLVFSEADGLSGLTVDCYGDWLIVQVTSLALSKRLDLLVQLLQTKLQPRGIWLRTEKGIREAEGLELADGLLGGEAPPRPLIIRENGVRFSLDLAEGQKTGFFLDQRDNRRRVAELVRGHRVLDVCCYSGGFALNCLVNGGATHVTGVDMSESALALARSNAKLNGVADRLTLVKRDCFKALEEFAAGGERFDTVILDPPKLARHRQGVEAALRGYYSLNRSALSVLKPGGILATCSCSGHVSSEMFVETLAQAALHENRRLQILEARGAAADHPTSVTCLETDYLKCYLCRVV
jgi:23S rRNA (cytosine1962-C5)-methyltransferase